MHFDFTDDQYAFRDAAREVLAGECTPAALRATWDTPDGRSPERWAKLAETGILGLCAPASAGGMGMDDVDLVLLLEEAGRVALPEPIVEHAGVAIPLLAEAGTDAQRDTWLGRLAGGDAVAAVQLGGTQLVSHAQSADVLLCERDGVLHCVPAEGFTATPQPSLDGGRRIATVEVEVSAGTRMDGEAEAAARGFWRGAVGTAAFLNGVSQRLLADTVAYVSERQQFNRPIGSFQAVKHKLAEVLLVVETARPAAWYAAYAIANDLPDAAEAAAIAKSAASDAAAKANAEALQCHGGIGFTWEHDLHLWLKRARVLESVFGTAAEHRAVLADAMLGPVGA